jgi:hypothetical protein
VQVPDFAQLVVEIQPLSRIAHFRSAPAASWGTSARHAV